MEVDYGIISIAVVKKKCISKGLETKKTKIIVCNKDHVFLNYSIVNFEKSFARIRLFTFLF